MTAAPDKRPAFESAGRLLRPTGYDPDMKRPPSTTAGVVLVLLRVIAGVLYIASVALDWRNAVSGVDPTLDDTSVTTPVKEAALVALLIFIGVVLVLDAVLAFFILAGRNWARVTVMTFSAISITTSFLQWWDEGADISLTTSLVTLGLDILVLLALSSRSAAAYARRNERP
jgi:hypothetical protein